MPPNPSELNPPKVISDSLQIDQAVRGDRAQSLGQMSGGTAIANLEGREVHIGDRIYQTDPETVKRIVREELQIVHREYGEPVRQGLNALADLMQASTVRDAVTTFRIVFEAACDQIDAIANYKALHDLLHTLEFQCYSGIVQESRRFPEDETTLDILMDHELTFQNLLTEMQRVVARETIAAREVQWLTDLQKAQAELHQAIETLETRPLQRTIWLLNRILAIQPSRINTNLTSAARSLRLPDLVSAMTFIAEEVAKADLDVEKQSQFQQGVAVLSDLNQRLTALIVGHDYWQQIALELRRIEANLEQDLIELEMSWPDLKERAVGLFDRDADSWTIAFQQDVQNLDDALKTQNPIKIKRYFRMYRRRASDRFFQVDVTLKRLCEELREVGVPLASVLRMIQ
ncbi:MAG: hypothetical protein NW220_02210 [Leptolyngbyaceae cyanobacterium bins.349]|nr:hypothetical protein [Leptolyngbyaceae cyanobacterium bins.349]